MAPKWPKIIPNGPKMTPGFTHFFDWKSSSANFFALRMYGIWSDQRSVIIIIIVDRHSPLSVRKEWYELAIEGKFKWGVRFSRLHTALEVVPAKVSALECKGSAGEKKNKNEDEEKEGEIMMWGKRMERRWRTKTTSTTRRVGSPGCR